MFDDLLSPSAVRSLAQGRLSGPLEVVPFGIPRLDQSIGYWGGRKGVPFGEYGIIGGASSSGKTQFGLHILNQASMAGVSSGMISLEMTREDIMLRLAQSWTPSIDATRWEPGRWRQEVEARELLSSQADVREKFRAPVWVNDKASGDLDWVVAMLDQLLANGTRFIILDHIQLVKVPGVSNAFDRAELVSETIRDWAFTNRATLIALSQLKRQASDDYTRSPTIHDLLGGTTLESNASQIWLLDHSRYRKDPQRRGGARTWIGHGKNRLGESRYWVPVYVDHPRLKFTEADTQERDSWPDHPKRKR